VHGEIALESTPNGAGGIFYEEWQRAAETGYQRHFFPWWIEPGYVAAGSASLAAGNCLAAEHERSNALAGQHSVIAEFTAEESALMRKHSLTAAQILFRRELRSNFRSLAAQEFAEDPESCFLASGECVFDLELIGRRLRELPAPIESRDNGRLLIWLPPRPACPPAAAAPMQLADSEFKIARPAADGRAPAAYLVAVDPAGGSTEGDYTCAQVIELRTGLQCAELHGHFTPAETARRVAQLAREYGHAMIAVERNNHGHAVLAHLTSTERYENVYLRNGQLGWLTSAVTRPQMIEAFAAALTAAPELFSSPRLLRECRSFVRRSDGSPAAAAGAHDDCVMAMAIAMAVRSESQFALPHRAPVEPCFASAALAR
ncbi:MAG TPA: hypothetical protein VE998_13620, partial [Terriglobales bacterium]|nr:hypothetical protein [Terriglobales bacterium]